MWDNGSLRTPLPTFNTFNMVLKNTEDNQTITFLPSVDVSSTITDATFDFVDAGNNVISVTADIVPVNYYVTSTFVVALTDGGQYELSVKNGTDIIYKDIIQVTNQNLETYNATENDLVDFNDDSDQKLVIFDE